MQEPVTRLAVLTALIGFLAAVNYRGVKSGAMVSNIFTMAKLAPLLAFAVAGMILVLRAHPQVPAETSFSTSVPIRNWLEAALVLMFAYGGFEGAVVPMAEARDPRRDVPFALYLALATTTALFCTIQYVVVRVLPAAAQTDRPLAAAAELMWGPASAGLISIGALISVYGYLSAQMLHAPRLTFALAERGDFPRIFAQIHRRFRTPHVSVLLFAGIVWCLALAGNFKWNVLLSSVGRLFVYGFTCASLPVLRRSHPEAQAHRLPAGNGFAVLGILFVVVLATRMNRSEAAVILVTMAIAFANWLWARSKRSAVL